MEDDKLITWGERTYGADKIPVFQWNEGGKCRIGKFCSIADNVKIFVGGNHNIKSITTFPFNRKSLTNGNVIIGNDVWIAHGVTIMSGVTIGDGVVIAANSHVVNDIESYTVVGGNPAKYIKHRFEPRIIECLLRLKWWDLPGNEISNIESVLCEEPNYEKLIELIEKFQK